MKTERYGGWAVRITRADGTAFLASSADVPPKICRERPDALQFADELAEQLRWPRKKLRVVWVEFECEVFETKKKAKVKK